jgi:hypothetical protein
MTGPISHLLNRTLDVWRPAASDDGYGGRPTVPIQQGEVRAKVDQAATSERALGPSAGSPHTHDIYLEPTADVLRGDQLRGDGDTFRVISTVTPSTPAYLKAECEQIQPAPT